MVFIVVVVYGLRRRSRRPVIITGSWFVFLEREWRRSSLWRYPRQKWLDGQIPSLLNVSKGSEPFLVAPDNQVEPHWLISTNQLTVVPVGVSFSGSDLNEDICLLFPSLNSRSGQADTLGKFHVAMVTSTGTRWRMKPVRQIPDWLGNR